MSSSGDLLRLLVPTVSPVPTQGPGAAPRNVPIESRSFDSLLEEAGQSEFGVEASAKPGASEDAGATELSTKPADDTGTLSGLSGIESIENASLRRLVAHAARQG